MDFNELIKPEVQAFIREHEDKDPHDLMLKSGSSSKLPMRDIAQQIQSRKKAKKKLPQWYDVPGIIFPASTYLEQSSSEKTGTFKASLLQGKSIVDLTGGSGVDAFYFSQQFEEVVYSEPNENLFQLAMHNFTKIGQKNVTFVNSNAEDFIQSSDKSFDWVYIDPSRRQGGRRVFQLQDCQPDLLNLVPLILSRGAKILIKLSPLLDITAAMTQLGAVSNISAISVNNDCKELLFQVESKLDKTLYEAVNITDSGISSFIFKLGEEELSTVNYSAPISYLYEPNASVMKLGAFKLISEKFDLFKLHPNTHLYTSERLIDNFPGRTFKIIISELFHWGALKDKGLAKANLAIRNFPHSVEAIRKRTGIKEGGDRYLFFARAVNDILLTIVCEKND